MRFRFSDDLFHDVCGKFNYYFRLISKLIIKKGNSFAEILWIAVLGSRRHRFVRFAVRTALGRVVVGGISFAGGFAAVCGGGNDAVCPAWRGLRRVSDGSGFVGAMAAERGFGVGVDG